MTYFLPILLSAFFTGLAGTAHCLSMCGGIGSTLGIHSHLQGQIFSYQAGRLFSYSCLGFFCGWILPLLGIQPSIGDTGIIIRRISTILIALIGIMQILNLQALRLLERYGYHLWKPLNRFLQNFLPIRSHTDAFLIGCLWGLLPCGLIYAALVIAISRANPLESMAVMASFGLGTLPAMLGLSLFSRQLSQLTIHTPLRRILGILILLMAIWSWH